MKDRILPQCVEIESALLGTILSFSQYQDLIIPELKLEMFYVKANRIVFQSVQRMAQKGIGIDMLTVTEDLRNNNEIEKVGGAYYVASLTSNVGSGLNYETHVQYLKQTFIRREMLKMFSDSINLLYEDETDISDIYASVGNKLDDLFSHTGADIHNMVDVMGERMEQIGNIKKGEMLGVPCGFKKIDENTNGWQKGDMIVLGARPSMGKTVISALFAKFPIMYGYTALYFSLEMQKERIADRLISLETGINSMRLQQNNLNSSDWKNIDTGVNRYLKTNFLINDESGLTIEQITSRAVIRSKKEKIDLIVIDYLQLIAFSAKNGTTNDQVGHISKKVKALAKKIDCPVIVLSQLSRKCEERGDKRPMLSDLRDSGTIEQDADIVMFLYRDDYYYDNSEFKNIIEVLMLKHRNGALGKTDIHRNDDWSKISDEEIFEIPAF